VIPTLSAAQRAELEAWENRDLSPEEFEARARQPMTEHEREEFEGLVSWFTRRYPTAGERLAHQRRVMQQWLASRGAT
jgi:hypothetical protein